MKKKHLKDMKKWRAQQKEQMEEEQAKKWFGLWKKKTIKPSKDTPDSSVRFPEQATSTSISNFT